MLIRGWGVCMLIRGMGMNIGGMGLDLGDVCIRRLHSIHLERS